MARAEKMKKERLHNASIMNKEAKKKKEFEQCTFSPDIGKGKRGPRQESPASR